MLKKLLFLIFGILNFSVSWTSSEQAVSESAICDQNEAVRELIFRTDQMERVVTICMGCSGAREEVCVGANNISPVTDTRRLCCDKKEAINKIIVKDEFDKKDSNRTNVNNTYNIDNTTSNNNYNDFVLICKSLKSNVFPQGRDSPSVKNNNSIDDEIKCKSSFSVKGDSWTNINCENGTFLQGLKLNSTWKMVLENFPPADFQETDFLHFVTPICTKGPVKSEGPKVAQSSVPVLGAIGVTFFVVVCFMVCRNFRITSVLGTKSSSNNLKRDGDEMVHHGFDGEIQGQGGDEAEEMQSVDEAEEMQGVDEAEEMQGVDEAEEMVEDGVEAIQLT